MRDCRHPGGLAAGHTNDDDPESSPEFVFVEVLSVELDCTINLINKF